MQNNMKIRLEAVLVFAIGLFLFSYGLFNHDEFVQFETRFALFAQEMLRHGISFFPTTYGLPYPDYPATQTILIYALSVLFNGGKLSIITAVLPSAVAAAGILALTYSLAAMHSRVWGVAAILFTLASYEFFAAARSVTLDPFVALATILAFYGAYTARHLSAPKRYWLVPIALVFGFIFRGPIGLIVPAGVTFVYYVLETDWVRLKHLIIVAGSLLVAGMLLLLLAAWHQGGVSFVKQVLALQIGDRFNTQPSYPFYYFINALASYAIAFPIACAVGISLSVRLLQRELTPELRLVRHAIAWTTIVLLGFSIPTVRKIRYILPMMPAVAIIAGALFVSAFEQKRLLVLRRGIIQVCYVLPFICLPMIPAALIVAQMKSLVLHTHALFALSLLISAAVAVVLLNYKVRQQPQRDLSLLACGVFVIIVLIIFVVEPLTISLDRAQLFVTQVMQKRKINEPIIFYQIGPDAEDIKFMTAYGEALQPLFAKAPAQIVNYNAPAIIIAKQVDFDNLPVEVKKQTVKLVEGKIGHRDCIAFTLDS